MLLRPCSAVQCGEDLRYFEAAVNSAVKAPINQNQFDALVSFAFNVGVEAFKGTTLLRLLNRKHYISAAEQFLRWTRGGGKVLPGLVTRLNQGQMNLKSAMQNRFLL